MASSAEVTMLVWRGDAKGGAFKEYRVPVQEGMVVLDVIHTIQATQAGDLACRWNCKAGKCGSGRAGDNRQPPPHWLTPVGTLHPGAEGNGVPPQTPP